MEASWKAELNDEFDQAYFKNIFFELDKRKFEDKIIYPKESLIFNAFNLTPFKKVKVVIIGQDPYHNPGEALGLSFSVPSDKKIPPSLRNIYKEIERDLCISRPDHGDLTYWAKQGVFLLNAMLTVEHKSPGSHKKLGWQEFTNSVIRTLSNKKENLVFLLWGKFAQTKKVHIDQDKHYVLEAAHPSPLARNAFSGCSHFSMTNAFLEKINQKPIDWNL